MDFDQAKWDAEQALVKQSMATLPLRNSMMGEQFFTAPALAFETQRWSGTMGFHEWRDALANEENA